MADPVRIQAIKDELDTDPLGRGYSGMTDQQATDSLNNADSPDGRIIIKSSIPGSDAFKATVDTEYDALTPENRQEWLGICGLDELEPENGKPAASTVIRLFGGGSATTTALQALRQEVVSRSVELGIGSVVIGDIQNARAL